MVGAKTMVIPGTGVSYTSTRHGAAGGALLLPLLLVLAFFMF
jgi:hypothetical protein